ncbi:MAG TPA: hypothetical protein PLD10_16290 [Rhodopila sp.]|nr:hypothetical protein [Rhodopila sp.]
MTQEVTRYGVHWASGKIAYLHQGRGARNAIGLDLPSPFHVRTLRRWVCNHVIGLNTLNRAKSHFLTFESLLAKNSLVRFFLPLPKDADRDTQGGAGVFATRSVEDDLVHLTLLMKMSSPVKLPLFWARMTSAKTILEELEMTDVQPLVLAGVEPEHTRMAVDLLRAARNLPRRLLVVARNDVPINAPQLTGEDFFLRDETDLAVLPWENLGSQVLKAYMRAEWEGQWFLREPIPGNEHKSHGPATSRIPSS